MPPLHVTVSIYVWYILMSLLFAPCTTDLLIFNPVVCPETGTMPGMRMPQPNPALCMRTNDCTASHPSEFHADHVQNELPRSYRAQNVYVAPCQAEDS